MSIEAEGIKVHGAREHNLKNVSVFIPRNKITVVTGLSGSGKSSLAFDTIYAEGQRRYVESLSAYARSFLEQLRKPDVDSIVGLSPAISIEQKNISTNPRSTVGTVTEIYDYLRLLFARAGKPYCPKCQIPVEGKNPSRIVEEVLNLASGTRFSVLAPMARNKKGEFHNQFDQWSRMGYVRARVDGVVIELANAKKLKKTIEHNIDLIVDRIVLKDEMKARIAESIHAALRLANGNVEIEVEGKAPILFSTNNSCGGCGFTFPEIEPRFFSFNNPRGACPTCNGVGSLGFNDEAPAEEGDFEDDDENVLPETICPDCKGLRLKPEALSVRVAGRNIAELAATSGEDLLDLVRGLDLDPRVRMVAEKIVKQIVDRLGFMDHVGVGYLTLDRPVRTLSGGEAQRVRLATQIGSSLIGILYVLDEPSIGLHPRDHSKLLQTLRELRDFGNTILLVEHDEDTIRVADHIIDLGPRAGILGGEVLAEGSLDTILKSPNSLTGQYLSGRVSVPENRQRRKAKDGQWLVLSGASGNNLKQIDFRVPLGTVTVVSGVSGSGKSSLIVDTLFPALSKHFYKSQKEPLPFKKITGLEYLDKVAEINQKPIGRTPRSNPATYVGLFSMIRELFAQHPESKIWGYKPGRFSFNVKGGRCENCMGGGATRVEMHFMADVLVPCDVCQGRRYNRETLTIKYRGKSIADVLDMSVGEALDFFKHHDQIHRKVETLHKVGLDYITLGQSSTTLSGGEAQRVKLSRELSKRGTGKTLYILDEPTTGLHFADVHKLIELLHTLAEQGNTILIIEHNLDVIRSADYVVDLGPAGGPKGGAIVAQGTPEEIRKNPHSVTGPFLTKV